MRLVELVLKAYGPFTGQRIVFAPDPVRLHLVFGRNEAGKSTSLRAIGDLLYGIPNATRETRAQERRELAGTLGQVDGRMLAIARRRGRKLTLTGVDGSALSEADLSPYLGATTRELFEQLYGLDHQRLRLGANELFAAGGAVGESLFAAALGGVELHQVLQDLRESADGIFRARVRTSGVQKLVGEWKELQRQTSDASASATQWSQLSDELADLQKKAAGLRTQIGGLERDRLRLERIVRVAPLRQQRERIRQALADLGPVKALSPDTVDRRQCALEAERDAARDRARIEHERAEWANRVNALAPEAEDAASLQAQLEKLEALLARAVSAEDSRPRLRARVGSLEEDVFARETDLGRDGIHVLGLGVPEQAQIRSLAAQRAELQTTLAAKDQALSSLRAKRAALAATGPETGGEDAALRLQALEREIESIGHALADGEAALALTERVAEVARTRARLERECTEKTAALGFASPVDPGTLPVPSQSVLASLTDEYSRHELRARHAQEQLRAGREHAAACRAELAAIESRGTVPTEAALERVRVERDAAWSMIRRAWKDGANVEEESRKLDPRRSLEAAFETRLAEADHLADGLRLHAGAVAERQRLRAEIARAAELEQQAARADREARAAFRGASDRWKQTWVAVGAGPNGPADAQAWLARYSEWVGLGRRLDECRTELETLRSRQNAAENAIRTGTGAGLEQGQGLSDAVGAARGSVAHRRQELEALGAYVRARAELESDLAIAENERHRELATLSEWQDQWSAATAAIGPAAARSTEVVLSSLELAREIRQRREELRVAREDLQLHETAVDALAANLVTAGHASHLEAARARVQSLRERLARRTELDALSDRIRLLDDELRSAEARSAEASSVLAALLREACVPDLGALSAELERAETAARLGRDLASATASLLEAADGRALGEIDAELTALPAEQARLELSRLDEALSTLAREERDVAQSVGARQASLARFGPSDRAAALAEHAQALAAGARDQLRDYLALRLASRVTERAVERFRETNQDRILERASMLLAKLTHGSLTGIHVEIGEDNQPVLACARPDGSLLGVSELSDGARDQLFLALRLAAVERVSETGEPLPMVLDDALTYFDEDRARAALRVFAELTPKLQVILFTHSARFAELARAEVADDRLQLLDLEALDYSPQAFHASTQASSV